MDRKSLWAGLVAGGIVAMAASVANAQTNITVWDFNHAIDVTSPVPTIGTGTASLIGGTTGAQVSGSGFGQPAPDNAWNSTTYPAQGAGSGTAGVQFQVSTVGFTACTFSFDIRGSTSPSKYVMPQCSTDAGATWTDLMVSPYSITAASTFYAVPAMPLPVAADNNADVRVRVVSVFAPATSAYTPVSAATYAVTGTLRYDRVTFAGTTTVSQPPVLSGASIAPTAFCAGSGGSVSLYVNVAAGQNPASLSYTVTADLSQIGGSAAEPLSDLGGGLFGFFVPVAVTGSAIPGIKTIAIHCVDDQARTADASTTFGVGDCSASSSASVVIAKIYGGGGATVNPTPIKEDYVVLYNRTCNPVDITNWSIQYAAAGGSSIANVLPLTPASGTLVVQPHKYFLVQLNHAGVGVVGTYSFDANTVVRGDSSVITPDFAPATGAPVQASGTAGVFILANIATSVGTNFADPSIQDMVGYGTAIHFEGAGAANAPTSSSELNRKVAGDQDSNQNFNDFDLPASPAPINSADPANTGAPACTCPADLDDGSGTGTPDGGVDINDLLYFLAQYEGGLLPADLDDGSGTGTPDGGVDINDLLFFLTHYEAGC